ncbi:hypothetical protein VP01_1063g1 [Puccinia sorghi]|uniref:Integrase catalytic domain-containing protein n=1 Tax=Puccinia sorghi TaxID=27349 RepID=A0A0L6VTU9_9BASI|nr:hypothetical protein VP01_1063g1 [Puccinia sorghi]
MNSFSIKKIWYSVHDCLRAFWLGSTLCLIRMTQCMTNLPTISFNNLKHECLFSLGEMLHKALGHVSYRRIRQKLGIPLKDCNSSLIPFEEIPLNIVGPITPASREGHQYFLTVVDSCTRYCSAIPIKSKNEVGSLLAQAIDLEAKQFGYYPTAKLKGSKLPLEYWNEIVKASTLALNQIPSHRSKELLYKLFKNRSLPLDYFRPIGLKASYKNLPDKSGVSKLAQIGEFGRIEKIINTKHLTFLDYESKPLEIEELIIEDDNHQADSDNPYEDTMILDVEEDLDELVESEDDPDIRLVASSLIPEQRILRERTAKVKPVKCSYLTGDPETFQKARQSDKSKGKARQRGTYPASSCEEDKQLRHKEMKLEISGIPEMNEEETKKELR